jgi:hypothetical protein
VAKTAAAAVVGCNTWRRFLVKAGLVTSVGSVQDYVEMARQAEAHGWDGVFVWDDISIGPRDVFDPWVTLGAMAMVTEHITLGAMVFSLARRRPWKVARESLTLDNLSNGRLVIPVGFGGGWDGGYSRVSTDEPSRKVRRKSSMSALRFSKRHGRASRSTTKARITRPPISSSSHDRFSDPGSRSGLLVPGRTNGRSLVRRAGTASSRSTCPSKRATRETIPRPRSSAGSRRG